MESEKIGEERQWHERTKQVIKIYFGECVGGTPNLSSVVGEKRCMLQRTTAPGSAIKAQQKQRKKSHAQLWY